MIIYKITNLLNNKVYIGKTSRELNVRINEHLSDSRLGSNLPIHNAIRKYGKDNFTFEIIDSASTEEELNSKEIYWIEEYNSYVHWKDAKGYNLSFGGDGAGIGENHHMYGIRGKDNHSSIPVVQLSLDGELIKIHENASLAGDEVNGSSGNITTCCRERIPHIYNSIWIYQSDFADDYIQKRVKMVESVLNRHQVVQLTTNGELVAIHNTAKDGAKEINGNGTNITACCKCKPKYKTYKGFIWLYISEYEDESVRAERIKRANSKWKEHLTSV